jgi:glucosamine-6-phosphate deaminase
MTGARIRRFPDADALGDALAAEIAAGIETAAAEGRRYVLGCPGGRSPRTTYAALARRLAGRDVGHLVIAMMDEYLVPGTDGGLVAADAAAHYSCRGFAEREIAGPIDALASRGIRPDAIWLPDPADPAAYERRLEDAGGIDLFLLASGASDGHIAFNPPGSDPEGGPWIVPLPASTRTDNLATFPAFRSLAEVPAHGVTVGLGTIVRSARRARLILTGEGKRQAAERILSVTDLDPAWPATIVHRCRDGEVWLDAAADGRLR